MYAQFSQPGYKFYFMPTVLLVSNTACALVYIYIYTYIYIYIINVCIHLNTYLFVYMFCIVGYMLIVFAYVHSIPHILT